MMLCHFPHLAYSHRNKRHYSSLDNNAATNPMASAKQPTTRDGLLSHQYPFRIHLTIVGTLYVDEQDSFQNIDLTFDIMFQPLLPRALLWSVGDLVLVRSRDMELGWHHIGSLWLGNPLLLRSLGPLHSPVLGVLGLTSQGPPSFQDPWPQTTICGSNIDDEATS